ncbi:MAG: phosphoserine phosphatase SerB [Maricaulaceae bacterium]|jgi:phosphoserine phosphatase
MPDSTAQALTLTVAAADPDQFARAHALAQGALAAVSADLGGETALSPTAAQIAFAADRAAARTAIARAFEGRPVDWSLQAGAPRLGRLLVCDMDSTIISCECIDEIADVLGIKPQIAEITERAMRGELPFEAALEERVARLKGVTEAQLEEVVATRVTLNPGAGTLTATMRAGGARAVLVSGGFTFFTARVAETAGFDVHHANTLEVEAGALTGRVVPPILGRQAKQDALERHAAELGASPDDVVGIGDGANDLDMLRRAGLGVAYRAKPIVEAEADARIATGDLRSALYFQGVRAADFVERG